MTAREFAPIAESLRAAVAEDLRSRGADLADEGTARTLETNSGLVAERGGPLVEIARRLSGLDSLDGVRVLDLGCGFGALALLFAAAGAEVTGTDQNAERMQVGAGIAREHGLRATFTHGRMQHLPFEDGSFDLIVQNNSLCYVVPRAERRIALAQSLRVLRPGGWLLVRDPNRLHPVDQFSGIPLLALLPPAWAGRAAEAVGRRRSLVRLATPFGAKRALRAAGFGEVAQLVSPASSWPAALKPVARYQLLCGRRPPEAAG